MNPSPHIIIIAGEISGDHHAASLVKALKNRCPACTFSGLGSTHLKTEGVELYRDMADLAVTGVWEALRHYRQFQSLFRQTLDEIKTRKPEAVILVDYPGFNLRLAARVRALGIKVIYYISPKVWAWKEHRVKAIKKSVDQLLVIFPFEVEYFQKHGIRAQYVGNPILDQIRITTPRDQRLASAGLSTDRLTIGLLPGSRRNEIERHLPLMIETTTLLAATFPQLQFLVLQAPTLNDDWFETFTRKAPGRTRVIKGDYYNALNACDVCLVASGTATLETACLEKPMIVLYKTAWLTHLLVLALIKIRHVSLVNIIAQKAIIPEYLQYETDPRNLSKALKNLMENEIRLAEMKSELRKIRTQLGGPGASDRAAQAILEGLSL